MKVIGLTGLGASGKGTVADYLCEKYGYVRLTISDIIKIEAKKEGLIKEISLEEDKKILSSFAMQVRKKANNYGVWAEKLVKLMKEKKAEKVVVDGFRAVEEVNIFRKEFPGFKLILINADQNNRFSRRIKDDPNAKKEDFLEREKRDMEEMGLAKVVEMADIKINNNDTKEELFKQIDRIL